MKIATSESDMLHARGQVVLIAGFLGAGKTTFLRHILAWQKDLTGTVILVNEFGQIGIDGQLLQGFDTQVVEMANGCICCSLLTDLVKTLADIWERFHPRRLFIEATGVADPTDILKVLSLPEVHEHLEEPKVVTVVDADFWQEREYLGALFYNQVRAADLVLLNKVDLQEAQDVPRYLREIREINPRGAVLPTQHCRVDPEVLWGLGQPLEPDTPLLLPDDFVLKKTFTHFQEPSQQLPPKFVAFAFESPTPFREKCFRHFISSMPVQLYRLKGYVLLGDKRFFLNHVGGKSEWADARETGTTRLAFVGWQVDHREILAQLKACLHIKSPEPAGPTA
jgi:G3E family GTPase